MKIKFAAVLFLVLIVELVPATGFQGKGSINQFAFVNVSLITMNNERVLKNHTVIVSKGRIAEIGPAAKVKIPSGAKIIDGKNQYLMPGLSDMHIHVWDTEDLVLYLANGVTTVRNMWGKPMHLEWKKKIASGELPGPTIYTAGDILDGENPIWPASRAITTPENARKIVEGEVKAGYDFIKVYSKLSPSNFAAIMEAAKKQKIPVAGHIPWAVDLETGLRSGINILEHLYGYDIYLETEDSPVRGKVDSWSRTLRFQHIDKSRISEIARVTKESGAWNSPTLVVFQKNLPPEQARNILSQPVLRFVRPELVSSWNVDKGAKLSVDDLRATQIADKMRKTIVKALHDADAPLLLGTDSLNDFVLPGYSIHEELRNLVDAGLSPFEAIKTGTVNAAKALGQFEEFGTISVGKRADLLLLSANPLQKVENISLLQGVMVRGKWMTDKNLQSELDGLGKLFESERQIRQTALSDKPVQILNVDEKAKIENPGRIFREPMMNSLGYQLLREKKNDRAIEIFRLNAQQFSKSTNAADSLSEAYEKNGNFKLAIEWTERVLQLLPGDLNLDLRQRDSLKSAAETRIEKLRKESN